MITSPGSGSISSLGPSAAYYMSPDRDIHSHNTQNPQFDSVSLSPAPTGDIRFHKDVVSRLSQEVRTATTTGDIQTLRKQVASGQYLPDPTAIAARILFLGEA